MLSVQAPDTKAKTDGQKNPSQDQAAEVRALGEEGADPLCQNESCEDPSCSCATSSRYVRITGQKQDAAMARSAVCDLLRQKRSPAKKSKGGGANASPFKSSRARCFIERVFSLGLCLKIPIRENLLYGKQDDDDDTD